MYNPTSCLSEEALLCSQVRVQDARDPRVCRARLSGLCSVHGVCERTGIFVTKVAPPRLHKRRAPPSLQFQPICPTTRDWRELCAEEDLHSGLS